MFPGIPGGSVGGFLYLLLALLTPVWESFRARKRKRQPNWRLVRRHVGLGLCLLAALALTSWAFERLAGLALGDIARLGNLPLLANPGEILRISLLLIGPEILAFLYVIMRLLQVVLRRRGEEREA